MTTKRRFIKHLPLLLAGLALGLGFFINIPNRATESSAIGNYSTNASTYYNDVTATSGKQLAAQLHDLITSTHRYYTSYADNGGNLYQQHTDQYYENGSAVNGYIYEFYSGVKWPNAWDANAGSTTGGYNREHCWCQSNSVPSGSGSQLWGESGGGSDMHHIRPTENRLNSTRGNDKYGTVSDRDSNKAYAKYGSSTTYHGGYSANSTFEPLDSKKGDVARIILYVYLHYNSYTVSDLFGSYGTTNGSGSASYFATSLLPLTNTVKANSESAALTLLLNWNSSDPVDEIEQRRNEQVAIYQGNRNPFIDNSNYANLIWGSGSSSTDPSASISPSSTSVAVDGTVNLTATLSNVTSASSISWTSSDTNKATVAKGTTTTSSSVATVTGKAAGTATIYCQYNETTIGSAIVTVTTSGGSGGGDSDYTLVTSNSSLSNGDKVVITTKETTPKGVSGWNNNKDATVSTSTASWMQFTVGSASSSGFTLKDETANNYIASPGGNEFKYGTAGTVSVDSEGHCICNSRYLCVNGTNYRFYTSIGSYTPFYIYKVSTSSSTKTLSSIAVSTAPTKTSYNAGEYFDPTGLVIRRNYSDSTYDTYSYAGHTSEFSFSPSTSTALTTSNTSVTISYGGKSCNQAITVAAVPKALSSISVSGQKTSFTVGDTFSFGGIVTATFNDSTSSNVTSSASFSGYNMSQVGNQTVTVSYTYSGVTKTTTYEIVVNASRVVMEETTTSGYVAIGTITYPNNTQTISVNTLSVSTSGYTAVEDTSIRLGSGSNTGSITVTSTTTNITKVVASVKAYGSDTSVSFTIDGTSNTLTSSYSDYSKTFNSAVKTVTFATITSKKRANIQSITVYKTGTITEQVDISNTSDCLGLESFISDYMHMDYTQNLGYCKDNTHHYYSTAKAAFNALNTHQRSLFVNNSAYAAEWARLAAWANANGESINSNNQLTQRTSLVAIQEIATNSNIIVLMAVILVVGISSIGMYVYINKKRIKE